MEALTLGFRVGRGRLLEGFFEGIVLKEGTEGAISI
jgi:hypothetical protein